MGVSNYYNKTVTLERLSAVAGTKKETWQPVVGDISCAIHPLEGSQQELLEGGFFNTYKMFCSPSVDLRIGDRVIDGSDTYTVKGIKTFNFAGNSIMHHKNIILVKSA